MTRMRCQQPVVGRARSAAGGGPAGVRRSSTPRRSPSASRWRTRVTGRDRAPGRPPRGRANRGRGRRRGSGSGRRSRRARRTGRRGRGCRRPGTTKTSRMASCCSWSSSMRSETGASAPVLSTDIADLEQALGLVPVDQLGPDDAGVGAERLLHEGADGVGLEGDVVVAEQVEGWRPRPSVDGHVGGRRRSPGCRSSRCTWACGQHGGHLRRSRSVSLAASMTSTDRSGVGLVGEALERLREPVARVVGDDHRDHRGTADAASASGLAGAPSDGDAASTMGRGYRPHATPSGSWSALRLRSRCSPSACNCYAKCVVLLASGRPRTAPIPSKQERHHGRSHPRHRHRNRPRRLLRHRRRRRHRLPEAAGPAGRADQDPHRPARRRQGHRRRLPRPPPRPSSTPPPTWSKTASSSSRPASTPSRAASRPSSTSSRASCPSRPRTS